MQIKLLNEIAREIAGEQAVVLLDLLVGKKDVNEFLIAKKLKLTINQIRNIFYKLSNVGMVTFTRKKDKRKGWYTYFWTLDSYRCLELLEKRIDKEIENMKNQLRSRETKRFYVCRTCKTEVGEETVLLHNFMCQECGQVYELQEDQKIIALLKSRIERFEKQKQEVLEELGKLKEEKSKKIKSAEKREIAKKKAKRKEARKVREKEKKMMNKKHKKVVKAKKSGKKKRK